MCVKRPIIGLQITNIVEEYPKLLFAGVADRIAEIDANLIVFRGESINAPWGYGYQFNAVYNLISRKYLDALIIGSGSLCNYISADSFNEYIETIRSIPLVSLAVPIEGVPSLLVDNIWGVKRAVEHLAKVHNRKHIAFIRGPITNNEAQLRYQAYLEGMAECGISVNPDLVYVGNFVERSGYAAVTEFIDQRKLAFDAIIAANDTMAIGAMNELLRRDYALPEDVSVIGFDNIPDGENIVPALSTVKQPLYQIAYRAVDIALQQCLKQTVEKCYLFSTVYMSRNSCGCTGFNRLDLDIDGCKDVESTEKIFLDVRKILDQTDYYSNHGDQIPAVLSLLQDFINSDSPIQSQNLLKSFSRMIIDQIMGRVDVYFWREILERIECLSINKLLLRKAQLLVVEKSQSALVAARVLNQRMEIKIKNIIQDIIAALSVEDLMHRITDLIPRLGLNCCYVFAYNKPIRLKKGQKFPQQDTAHLLLAFDREYGIKEVCPYRMIVPTTEFIPEHLVDWSRRRSFIVIPMFFLDEQYGYLVFEMSIRDGNVFDLLALEIGATYRSVLLIEERLRAEDKLRRVLNQMEDANSKLTDLSESDDLTGLYNRRGFLRIGEQNLQIAQRMKSDGVLFFIDLDNLKLINDTCGHNIGDIAITSSAKILEKVFRRMDLIARLGGDEFVVLTLNTDREIVTTIRQRLDDVIGDFNRELTLNYQLSMSIGEAYFAGTDSLDLQELMNEADRELYKVKRAKKVKLGL